MKKVVFITGASRGIGLATVKKFANSDWIVAGFYKNNPGPTIANVSWYQVDVRDKQNVASSFSLAFKDLKNIDCLINCAGIFGFQKLEGYSEELMDDLIATNEKGTYYATQIIIGKMAQGSIVNISSTAAQIGSTDPIYAATKGAILSFTKSMAKTLAPKIRVNAVAPGVTETDMMNNYNPQRKAQIIAQTPLQEIARPEEIAAGIYFLASDEASHITGTCLDISGGYVLR